MLHAIPTRLCLTPIYRCKQALGRSYASFNTLAPLLQPFATFTNSICSFHGRFAGDPRKREVTWGPMQYHDVLRVLHQPAYAGAYVGWRAPARPRLRMEKSTLRSCLGPNGTRLYSMHMWGTLAFEDYERNEAQLSMNSQAYAPECFSPPREGPALLQGLIMCGKCGERMTVRYHQRAGEPHCP